MCGIENIPMEDHETTFPQLYERIEKTIDMLKKVDPSSLEGKDNATVEMKTPFGNFEFTGKFQPSGVMWWFLKEDCGSLWL